MNTFFRLNHIAGIIKAVEEKLWLKAIQMTGSSRNNRAWPCIHQNRQKSIYIGENHESFLS
jgi:hypothetical protein